MRCCLSLISCCLFHFCLHWVPNANKVSDVIWAQAIVSWCYGPFSKSKNKEIFVPLKSCLRLSPSTHRHLLPTGSKEREVLRVRSIPVAILPSCQVVKTVDLYLHK